MKESETVYISHGTALGDIWGTLNVYLGYAVERNEIIRVSTWYSKGPGKIRYPGERMREIYALLDCPQLLKFVEDEGDTKFHWSEGGASYFYPTFKTWAPNKSGKVCYQFDGKTHKEKNFPNAEAEEEVLDAIRDQGYTPVKLDKALSLRECVEEAATCEFYVGVCSGMSHLCHAVRTPMILARNKFSIENFRANRSNEHKHFINCVGKEDVKEHIQLLKEEGMKHYLSICQHSDKFKEYLDGLWR